MNHRKKAIYLDGFLYSSIAAFTFLQGYFTSDDSYKYCSPVALFWLKAGIGLCASVAGALKMYRSQSFARHTAAAESEAEEELEAESTPDKIKL